jgi:glyoxylase-like metal-dependent hydrolase (beta-lactamase superfamily II)
MIEEVRLLSAGFCLHAEAMTLRGGSWTSCRYPAGFALIQHAKHGPILFDTGYSDHIRAATSNFPGFLYPWLARTHVTDTDTALHQLEIAGIRSRDVRHIVVSHFHADHMAGLRDFPAARILCTRAGWNSVRNARGVAAVAKGFLPGLMPSDIEQRISFVEDIPPLPLPPPLDKFGFGRDLLDDGSIIAIDLPGHAVGQIGLWIQGLSAGPMLLVADAAWSRRAVEEFTPSPRLTSFLLGNTVQYRATLRQLHGLWRAMPELAIVPSHCRDTLANSRIAKR